MSGKLILEYRGQRAEMKTDGVEMEALAAAIGVSADKLDTCCACPYWGQMECESGCDFPEEARELWPDLQLRLWGLIRGAGLHGPIPEDERKVKAGEHMPPMHGPNIDDGHPTRHCGHCHTCGTPLKRALDGEEWCSGCGDYKRYPSHGWAVGAWGAEQDLICPQPGVKPTKDEILGVMGQLIYWGRRAVERQDDAFDHLPAALKQALAVSARAGVEIEGWPEPTERPTRVELLTLCQEIEPFLAKAVEIGMETVLPVSNVLRAVQAAIVAGGGTAKYS